VFFFKLPYWSTLKLRHNLDVMHIEKNMCDSVLGTLMNMDLCDMGIRRELHLQTNDAARSMPPAK